jgi:hypothetical protein
MFYDIYFYTLCYYICCLLWRMYEMHLALFLKVGCYSEALPPEDRRKVSAVRTEGNPTQEGRRSGYSPEIHTRDRDASRAGKRRRPLTSLPCRLPACGGRRREGGPRTSANPPSRPPASSPKAAATAPSRGAPSGDEWRQPPQRR